MFFCCVALTVNDNIEIQLRLSAEKETVTKTVRRFGDNPFISVCVTFYFGEFPVYLCPGVGNRMPSEEEMANPQGCARGRMVTVGIEPCIILHMHVCTIAFI